MVPLTSGILSSTEVYGTDPVALVYDGTMVLWSHADTIAYQGRALLMAKSGGSLVTDENVLESERHQLDRLFWGGDWYCANNAKDKFVVAAKVTIPPVRNMVSVHIYTNAIPDFISFDTYNKLSLSGITNPTSKLHVLPTGAESTTTYDIGSATNIYIESEGTYTAEMKGVGRFRVR